VLFNQLLLTIPYYKPEFYFPIPFVSYLLWKFKIQWKRVFVGLLWRRLRFFFYSLALPGMRYTPSERVHLTIYFTKYKEKKHRRFVHSSPHLCFIIILYIGYIKETRIIKICKRCIQEMFKQNRGESASLY
jgi:hypothetical protein